MKVYGLWYGGNSYAVPSVPDDVEEFSSIKQAKDIFESRFEGEFGFTPCVTDESEMHLFYDEPQEGEDINPDVVLSFGPRGGVIRS